MRLWMKYKANTDLRSKILNKNIIVSVFLQGLSMVISLILLPLSLKFVSVEQYGIWLTINSILLWSANFDLGLGSGLKNALGNALAKNDEVKAKQYISTAYFIIIIIMGTLSLLYFMVSDKLNWVQIFRLDERYTDVINRTINVVVYLFFARFVLQLVNVILDSMQKLYLAKINNALSQILILITILLYSKFADGDILKLGIVFSLAPVLTFLASSIWLFANNQKLAPSINFINIRLIKELYGIGLKFFVIQITMIFLFQTTNILIIRFYGPDEVVVYNVAYSLFSMIAVAFSTISAPYWASYTNAWALNDLEWIKKTNRKLINIWFIIIGFALIVLIFSNKIYLIWLNRDLNIPLSLSLAIFLYMCVFSFGGIYNMFINGVGKLKLQLVSLGVSAILYFPILWVFVKVLDWGLISFPLALLVISSYSLIIAPIQYQRLLNGTAEGIWNK